MEDIEAPIDYRSDYDQSSTNQVHTGERISDELRQEMLLQEEIAQSILEEMDKQG